MDYDDDDSTEKTKKVQRFWKSSGLEELERNLKNNRLELNASDFINPGDVEDAWDTRNELRNRMEDLIQKNGLASLAEKCGIVLKDSSAGWLSDDGLIDRVTVLQILMEDLLELERLRKKLWMMVNVGQRQSTINTFNIMGGLGTLIFAPAAFVTNCIWLWRCNKTADSDNPNLFCKTDGLQWGSMGLHPFLMSAAFLLFVPSAACAYRAIRGVCGASHSAAMIVHVLLQITAAILAGLGVSTAWISHESSGTPHFHSSHSIMGSVLLSVYAAQIITSLFVFIWGSNELRASFHILHMAAGQAVTFGGFLVAAMGIIYFESETYSNNWDDSGTNGYWRPMMTVTQYCIICAMMSMVLLFYGKLLKRK